MVAYREEEEEWVRGCGTSMAGETGAELLDANGIVLVWRLQKVAERRFRSQIGSVSVVFIFLSALTTFYFPHAVIFAFFFS